MSESKKESETEEPVLTDSTVTESSPDAPIVELSASTKPPEVTEQRPILLPRYTPEIETSVETTTTMQIFEIGSDTSIDEPTDIGKPAKAKFTYPSAPARWAPTYPERPVPSRGMTTQEVLAAAGEPAKKMDGIGSEVWDYGTYRVFFKQDQVAFTRVW